MAGQEAGRVLAEDENVSMPPSPSPRFRAGIRRQATAIAATVVGAALVIGGLALVLLLQRSLTSSLEDSLVSQMAQDAQILAGGGVDALASSEADSGPDGFVTQVIDSRGQVVYSSPGAGATPLTTVRPSAGQTLVSGRSVVPLPGDLDRPLTVAQGVAHGSDTFVVLATSSQEPQQEAVLTTALLLVIGVPLLIGLAGYVTWRLLGRALRSVELIRGRVERIGATRLDQRVPVPTSRDEIAHLATTMNDMLARLETSSEVQRRFVADASHELRSPLATLTASLELAQQDATGQVWQELSPIIEDETARMRRLVDDLLMLSKVDDHALGTAHGDVDLDDLADQEAHRLRQVSGVDVTLRATPTRVLGDAHQLAQAIRNLVDNASRAATSAVRITVRHDGQHASLVVEDDGPGIAVADRVRVFDRFVRLDESRSRASGGSGLGLSIAHEIVRGHGGTLTIGDSALGGASVKMVIPRQSSLVDSR